MDILTPLALDGGASGVVTLLDKMPLSFPVHQQDHEDRECLVAYTAMVPFPVAGHSFQTGTSRSRRSHLLSMTCTRTKNQYLLE
jgi:hypothetical protein